MKLRSRAPVLALCVLGACSPLHQSVRDERIPITVAGTDKKLDHAGLVYLWPPYSSAAIVDGEGKRCVLAASGAKSLSGSSEAALKFGEALNNVKGLDASAKSELIESFTRLSAADSHAAFADIALFHLCMLTQNGAFKHKDEGHQAKAELIAGLYAKAIEAAANLSRATKSTPDEKK